MRNMRDTFVAIQGYKCGAGAGVGNAFAVNSEPLSSAAALFSWASVYELVPPLNMSCTNTAQLGSNMVQECEPGALSTGVTCNDAQCGRPADWPAGEPFFIPVDLYNASSWEDFGVPAAQIIAAAESPQDSLSLTQRSHLQVSTSAHVHACNLRNVCNVCNLRNVCNVRHAYAVGSLLNSRESVPPACASHMCNEQLQQLTSRANAVR